MVYRPNFTAACRLKPAGLPPKKATPRQGNQTLHLKKASQVPILRKSMNQTTLPRQVQAIVNGSNWYKEQLKSPEWLAKRQAIFKRDNRTCVDCQTAGVRIQCHHTYYVKGMKPWEYPEYALVTVCDKCHGVRHKSLITKHASHEDAEMWIIFADAEQQLIGEEIAMIEARTSTLIEQGAEWDSEGRYYSLIDSDGTHRFFDEDGNQM